MIPNASPAPPLWLCGAYVWWRIFDFLDEIHPSNKIKSYKELIKYVTDRPGHDFRYAIDSSKIKNELNFIPNQTIKSDLHKTIKWYLKNKNWIYNIKKNIYNQERLGVKFKWKVLF